MELSVYKSTSWKMLPWDKFRRKVFKLQCRIYDAMRNDDIQKTIKLQKCLIHSSSTHYIAIKECTDFQVRYDGRIIEGPLLPTFKEKLVFAARLKSSISNWKQSPCKKVSIFIKNGSNTYFSLPNGEDRIIQFIWKLALEPAHEARFSESSYGFRPGRTIWDMQKNILKSVSQLSTANGKKLLTMNFSNHLKLINHNFLVNKLVLPVKYKNGIYQSLKLGMLDGILLPISYHYSFTTLPFLLVNIAFHGLDDLNINLNGTNKTVYSCRYGGHFLYIFEEDEYTIKSSIDQFFHNIGASLTHWDATSFKSLNQFEFLGWYFVIKPSGKMISYPTKANWVEIKLEIKSILKNPVEGIGGRLAKIEKKLNRWYNYHYLCNMSELTLQFYTLRVWVNKYLRLQTSIPKEERYKLLRNIFRGRGRFYR
uniref:Group II intron protein n=1 Tax=Chroomonas placoidea TaxID=173977 RepID=A0A222AIC9_9CRYP|nr:group II intron protein [Chroomonas placoidea]ASO76142.1 group II intron protein [Chroomonas placoidea]